MSVSFDTNVLVYASADVRDPKSKRARELIGRGMRLASGVLLLQTLAEFSSVAIRKAAIPANEVRGIIGAWRSVLPVKAAAEEDLVAALEAVKMHRLAFWDAMLWASARRAGVEHLLTEDLQDGFQLDIVRFINPFKSGNDKLIDAILPP